MLRIIARRQRNKRLAIDDWLIILALAVYYALTGLGIWGVVLGGYGYWSDVTLIPLDFIELYLKVSSGLARGPYLGLEAYEQDPDILL